MAEAAHGGFSRGWAALIAVSVSLTLASTSARAEDAPQEPQWTDNAPTGDDSTPPTTATKGSIGTSATRSSGVGAPVPPEATLTQAPPKADAAGASPSASLSSTAAGSTPATVSPASPEQTVGVPESTNFFLPNFSNYGRPIFEREGLKFRAGPVNLRMALTLGATYNDNIYGRNTDIVADEIFHVVPTFLVGLGDYAMKEKDFLRLDYRPSFDYYLSQKQENRLNQNLELAGQAAFSRYSTKVDLTYNTSNSPNGSQQGGVEYSTTNFDWSNTYYLGAKTFARADTSATFQQSDNDNNYQTFSISPQIGYAYSPKTTVWIGPFAGIAFIGDGGTQTFQGVSTGFTLTNLRKLTLEGSVGVQARQFHGLNVSGASNFITPVFDLALTYEARQNTKFIVDLKRDVEISDILQGLTYDSTQITLSATQTFFSKISASLSFSFQILDYQGNDVSTSRTDYYSNLGGSLSRTIWKDSVSLSLSYIYQKRTSDFIENAFDANIYSVNVTWQF
ncbi:MAG TPA: outer membrane beta-barrel protein [Chthoniobacterales bacterium]|nr:outer membrane beta-barrel protein [Chthoniobacterales bacterium]